MRRFFIVVFILLIAANTALAEQVAKNYPPAKVSFDDFKELVAAEAGYRFRACQVPGLNLRKSYLSGSGKITDMVSLFMGPLSA